MKTICMCGRQTYKCERGRGRTGGVREEVDYRLTTKKNYTSRILNWKDFYYVTL